MARSSGTPPSTALNGTNVASRAPRPIAPATMRASVVLPLPEDPTGSSMECDRRRWRARAASLAHQVLSAPPALRANEGASDRRGVRQPTSRSPGVRRRGCEQRLVALLRGVSVLRLWTYRSSSLYRCALAEDRRTDAHDGSAFGDRRLEIVRHAHRELGQLAAPPWKLLQRAEPSEIPRGGRSGHRHKAASSSTRAAQAPGVRRWPRGYRRARTACTRSWLGRPPH